MRILLALTLLLPQVLSAQDAESLRSRIEAHYTAIHAGNNDVVVGHHLPDMSIFPGTGHLLMQPGWEQSDLRMGAVTPFPDANVTMRHFSAQIYGDVGIAIFYLDGTYGEERGTWRVSAAWVWQNGEWMEAHHHESRLTS